MFRNSSIESNAGFPSKVSESLSLFVPVITNDTGDLKKYIINGKNGFIIDIFNSDVATEQLNKIINLNSNDIFKMKMYCKNNKVFNIYNYREIMSKFLLDLEKK